MSLLWHNRQIRFGILAFQHVYPVFNLSFVERTTIRRIRNIERYHSRPYFLYLFYWGRFKCNIHAYFAKGVNYANSRFTFESWKSKVSDAKNHGTRENCSKPKNQKQTQLRKTCDSATKSRAKLGLSYHFLILILILL